MPSDDLTTALMHVMRAEMERICKEVEREAVGVLDREGRNYEGDTRKSIDSEARIEGTSVVGEVWASSGHAWYVHEGSKPHWPPYLPIRRWVEKKLGVRGLDIYWTTIGVQRAIARRGTKGTPFLREPVEAMKPLVEERITRTAALALNART